jgi:MFS family permease
MVGLALLSIGTATSTTAEAVFITRFFGGVFGSAPVSNVTAAFGDIWHPKSRGTAVCFYAIAVIGGPTFGPLIGSALVVNPNLGWRWTEYIEAICASTVFGLCLVALPETYHPVLLKRKAQMLRKQTGNEKYYHPHEHLKLDARSMVTKHFSRPMLMLFTEPMVTCLALYASFVYALFYLTLQLFPIVFQEMRGYDQVVASLPFLALFLGVVGSQVINLANQPYYAGKVEEAKGKPVPEARLRPMAIGGFLLVAGMFWFGWTSDPRYSWIVPTIAAGFFGGGFSVLFQQCINFLIDTYGQYSASATAANTFLRSVLAARLPMAASPMFHNLGVGPAMSILGGIAVLALPVPFIFMRYGLRLRKMSKFALVYE